MLLVVPFNPFGGGFFFSYHIGLNLPLFPLSSSRPFPLQTLTSRLCAPSIPCVRKTHNTYTIIIMPYTRHDTGSLARKTAPNAVQPLPGSHKICILYNTSVYTCVCVYVCMCIGTPGSPATRHRYVKRNLCTRL